MDHPHDDIIRARDGDRSALNTLLARNHDRLLRLTDRLLGAKLRTRVSVSDVLQSCYVDLVRGISRLEHPTEAAFEAWTRRIVENGVRRKCRELSAKKRGEGRRLLDTIDESASREPSPSGQAMTTEHLARLERALSRLREDRREILRLRVVEGRSHEEIADIMGRPLGATRMLLSRARAELSLEIERLVSPDHARGGDSQKNGM